ncbi:MAG TPA: MBG domain-containing protein, partial [Methylomirabilota bacterium]|nr:MBG domain-containing protein [Methylomirabilota bacterium]
DGANFAGGNGVGYSVAPDANLLGAATFGGSSQGARNVGTYGIDVGGFHSTQQGYLITYAPGTLTVTPKALTVTGVTANDKVYDAATTATLNTGAAALSGVVGADSVFLDAAALSGDFGDKNVGNGKAVRVAGAAITGGDAGNYTVDNPAGLTASITPAPLAVIADNQAKPAGAADPALTYGATGFVGPDTAATALAGALDRAAGETAGAYAITQGTLAALQGNYAIAYTAGLLTITAPAPPPAPSVSPAPPAPEPARADLARPPYPQPEVLRPPTCVGSGESDAANCVRTMQLQVVDGGVRLPPRP